MSEASLERSDEAGMMLVSDLVRYFFNGEVGRLEKSGRLLESPFRDQAAELDPRLALKEPLKMGGTERYLLSQVAH